MSGINTLKSVQLGKNAVKSICLNCNERNSCMYRNDNEIVYHCEDYSDTSLNLVDDIFKNYSAKKQKAPKRKVKYIGSGLCVNCDHNQTCINNSGDRTVYFCEDYE